MSVTVAHVAKGYFVPIEKHEVRKIDLTVSEVHALIWDWDSCPNHHDDGAIITAFALDQAKPGAQKPQIIYDPSKSKNLFQIHGQEYCKPEFVNFPAAVTPLLEKIRESYRGDNFPSDIPTLWVKIVPTSKG